MSKGLITALVIIGGIIVVVGGFFMWGTGVYDSAIKSQEDVNKSWSNVQSRITKEGLILSRTL